MLAAPLLVIVGAFALVAHVPGAHDWFWPVPDTNVAEATVVRDYARVRALAARGASLTEPLPVRAGLLRNAPPAMTALEAAIRIQSPALVEILFELGAVPAFDEAGRLRCLAESFDVNVAVAALERAYPIASEPCMEPGP